MTRVREVMSRMKTREALSGIKAREMLSRMKARQSALRQKYTASSTSASVNRLIHRNTNRWNQLYRNLPLNSLSNRYRYRYSSNALQLRRNRRRARLRSVLRRALLLSSPQKWRWTRHLITLPQTKQVKSTSQSYAAAGAGSTCVTQNFDIDGYPLTSRDASDERRFINPWDKDSCALEPFDVVMKWKWERFWKLKDLKPKSRGDWETFMTRIFEGTKAQSIHYRGANNMHHFEQNRGNNNPRKSYSDQHLRNNNSSIDNAKEDGERIKLTWIGHSTCLIQQHHFTILTDPIFITTVGPAMTVCPQWFTLFGEIRYNPPAINLEELHHHLPPHKPMGNGNSNEPNQKSTNEEKKVIDLVLISHDHYDHLDLTTLQALTDPDAYYGYSSIPQHNIIVKNWCVPRGLKRWMTDNCPNVSQNDVWEMEWWDHFNIEKDVQEKGGDGKVARATVTCAPAQHWGCRSPFDRNMNLWCSFAIRTCVRERSSFKAKAGDVDEAAATGHIRHPQSTSIPLKKIVVQEPSSSTQKWLINRSETNNSTDYNSAESFYNLREKVTPEHQTPSSNRARNILVPNSTSNKNGTLAFYYAGDTGLPRTFPLHRQIGDRLGPFDMSALPIGAYAPDSIIGDSHSDPGEARILHRELRSRKSVGVHWGTFALGDEPFYEPVDWFLSKNSHHPAIDEQKNDDTTTAASDGPDTFVLVPLGGVVESNPCLDLDEVDSILDIPKSMLKLPPSK